MTDLLLTDGRLAPSARLIPRIVIGAVQGFTLWWLLQERVNDTAPMAFAALMLMLISVPTLLIGGLGQMRLVPLFLWAAIAGALLAGFGGYDAWREMGWGRDPEMLNMGPDVGRKELTPLLLFCAPIAIFIAHHLIAAADRDRKPIANYESYFDIGWTSAVQIALAGAFTLALWLVLWLGAALFDMIGLKLLSELLGEGWFSGPVLGMAFAAGVHVSDARQGLARGMRTLALTLLGWLAPLLAGLTALFLIALPFTGLNGLWDTNAAAAILLTAAIILTALTNAAYQDGGADKAAGKLFQASSILTALALPALVALAAYALTQRISQYGLTPERIFAAACVGVAAVYALGYLATLNPLWRPLKLLEKTNILGAAAILAAFAALFSPLADPARMAAADQTRRLMAGKIAPETFDYAFLARDSGRFGRAQLDKLAALTTGANAAEIARLAGEAKAGNWTAGSVITANVSRKDRIRVYPKGADLPAWLEIKEPLVSCLSDPQARCNAYLIDLTGDGAAEAIFELTGAVGDTQDATVDQIGSMLTFAVRDPGAPEGVRTGQFGPLCSVAEREALMAGQSKLVAKAGKDVEINGRRLAVEIYSDQQTCPK